MIDLTGDYFLYNISWCYYYFINTWALIIFNWVTKMFGFILEMEVYIFNFRLAHLVTDFVSNTI